MKKVEEALEKGSWPLVPLNKRQECRFYMIHRIPTHSLIHVETEGEAPIFRIAKIDWFIDYLRAHPDAIQHEWIDDGKFPVLTAPTAELQAFIQKHYETEGAFENLDLKRVAETE